MALSSASNVGTATSTANTTTVTTGTLSPTANALLIVTNAGRHNASMTISSVTDTFTGTGSWTLYQAELFDGSRYVRTLVAVAQAGSSPGSGTVTVTYSANVARKAIALDEVTGHDTSTPVVQNNSNSGTGATLTVTQSGTPASTSLMWGGIGDADAGATTGVADANYTENFDIDSGGGGTQITLQGMYDLVSADTTTDWDSLASINNVGVAIEIAEAGGGVTLTVAGVDSITTVDAINLTQLHNLTLAGVDSITTVDAINLTQLHNLTVADVDSITTVDALSLTQLHNLTVAGVDSITTVDAVVITSGTVTPVAETWTLDSRSLSWTLETRDITWTVDSRGLGWTVPEDDR